MMAKNIGYDNLKLDFNKMYGETFKIEITNEFNAKMDKELESSLYFQ